MNAKQANAIYDILIQECGADEYWRENFVQVETSEECREYRFKGELGFGGKFWRNSGRMYVDCYSEDTTPLRQKMIDAANKRLENI